MELTELKRLAEKATPGPWALFDQYIQKPSGEMPCQWQSYTKRADAKYLAALSPERVLQMIRVIELAHTARRVGFDAIPIPTDFNPFMPHLRAEKILVFYTQYMSRMNDMF